MPIYEYECQQGHRFELRQGFHDDPAKACVECQQPVRRLLSPAGIIFKGSGWYITDSRSSSGRGGSENGETSSTKNESPTETKSETKSEAKPAAPENKSDTKAGAAA